MVAFTPNSSGEILSLAHAKHSEMIPTSSKCFINVYGSILCCIKEPIFIEMVGTSESNTGIANLAQYFLNLRPENNNI